MKTPREILLQKHQSATGSLSKIRAEVLRTEVSERLEPQPSPGIVQMLWEQLILPARRTWAGLACAWIVVVILQSMASTDEAPAYAQGPAPQVTPETRIALQAQQKLFAELLKEQPPTTPAHPTSGGPRSERRRSVRFA